MVSAALSTWLISGLVWGVGSLCCFPVLDEDNIIQESL